MVNTNTGYICGSTGTVKKTTNGGTNWDSLAVPSTALLYYLKFIDVNTGWVAGASGNMLKTTDAGATWTVQTSGITTTIYSVDFVNATTGWFSGASGVIRYTTDGGTTWTAQTSNYTSTLNELRMFNASTGYVVGLSGNIRKTTDGGTTWSTVTGPITSSLYSVDLTSPTHLMIGSTIGNIIKSTDGGTTWVIENTGGATINSIDMRAPDSAFAAGSGSYVHKFSKGIVGITEWQNEIPAVFYLSQNYPNPFNPATTIKFGIAKASKVTLKIYDITGREVMSLYNDMELNAGTITYTFDGARFSSGIYFYSLFANGEKIDTKKMVLVK